MDKFKVLLVDDEEEFVKSLSEGFNSGNSIQNSPMTASRPSNWCRMNCRT